MDWVSTYRHDRRFQLTIDIARSITLVRTLPFDGSGRGHVLPGATAGMKRRTGRGVQPRRTRGLASVYPGLAAGEGTGVANTPTEPEQLRREIEQTRAELGETVEALAAKAVVKARAQDAVDEVRSWTEILIAAALQGAIFAIVKAAVDRGSAKGVRQLTGSWPD